ncbi:hypothetical protein UPYG_G00058910 [Umbra pygmaea]|uniref:F-box domain-containing protein n=1 Tax=Umbra pygmaea TaxID=75934 RepID=A0ABD0XW99_UMBPY
MFLFKSPDTTLLLQISTGFLDVCLEVILSDGDVAYRTLSLTCKSLKNVVSTQEFRKRAHFAWPLECGEPQEHAPDCEGEDLCAI